MTWSALAGIPAFHPGPRVPVGSHEDPGSSWPRRSASWSQAAQARPQRRAGWDRPVASVLSVRRLRVLLGPSEGSLRKNIVF